MPISRLQMKMNSDALDMSLATEDPVPVVTRGSGTLRTVTLLIPLFYNPNKLGLRMPVWIGKIRTTLHELQLQFSGMNLSLRLGWCSEDRLWDPHLCIDFDAELNSDAIQYLAWWK